MKEHPMLFSAPMVRALLDGTKTQTRRLKFRGAVGDRVWVKETFSVLTNAGIRAVYRATDPEPEQKYYPGEKIPMKWTPSIFMPRRWSRILLQVVALREEPLQALDEYDSLAEGIPEVPRCGCDVCRMSSGFCTADAGEQIRQYAELWDHLNEKRAPWASNPTVHVVTFNRLVPFSNRSTP